LVLRRHDGNLQSGFSFRPLRNDGVNGAVLEAGVDLRWSRISACTCIDSVGSVIVILRDIEPGFSDVGAQMSSLQTANLIRV
jgi:hypothetical protein